MIHNTLIKDKTPRNDTTLNFHLAPPITLISLNNVTFPNTQKLSFEFKDMTHDHLIQKIETHGNKCKDAKPCIIQTCDASTCNEIGSHSTGAETPTNNILWITVILISFFK